MVIFIKLSFNLVNFYFSVVMQTRLKCAQVKLILRVLNKIVHAFRVYIKNDNTLF
jgi:hypothetical protein